jgi:hypothetical protein
MSARHGSTIGPTTGPGSTGKFRPVRVGTWVLAGSILVSGPLLL